MDTIKSWRIAVVAFSLLLICVLVWPMASLAARKGGGGGGSLVEGRFTCRASALRVNEPLGSIFEPIVANPLEDPCKTDNEVLVSVPPLVHDGVSAGVLGAATEDSKAPVTAEGFAVEVNVLDVVSAEVLEATAKVKSVKGKCVLSSESSVASALVQGKPIELIDDHLEILIPLVGTLHFNETLGGPNPTSGDPDPNRITQRALWLQVNPLLGLEDVIVGEATADFEGGNPCAEKPPVVDKRRMTGGGKFADGTTVTHGFVLHCNAGRLPNNLQVNWNGNSFHMESLTSAICSDSPGINPGQPQAGFDTYEGTGTGRLNGVSDATVEWTFTDAGEPGNNDFASILIKDKNGNTVLDVASALFKGNHQAHGE